MDQKEKEKEIKNQKKVKEKVNILNEKRLMKRKKNTVVLNPKYWKEWKSDVCAMSECAYALYALGVIKWSSLVLFKSYPFICSSHPSLILPVLKNLLNLGNLFVTH